MRLPFRHTKRGVVPDHVVPVSGIVFGRAGRRLRGGDVAVVERPAFVLIMRTRQSSVSHIAKYIDEPELQPRDEIVRRERRDA